MWWRLLLSLGVFWHMPAHANAQDSTASNKTMTIVADEWCPYNCKPDSRKQGFIVDIARAVFEKKGIRVVYQTMAWSEALERTRRGDFNAVVGAAPEDAPGFIFPKLEQGWPQIQFFVRDDQRWRYLGRDSLGAVKLGVAAAYSYGHMLDAYIRRHRDDASRILVADSDEVLRENVERLLLRDVDAIVEDALVMNHYLDEHDLTGKIKLAGRLPVSNNNGVFIAFSPALESSREYAALLDKGMEELRTSGELTAILARYGLKDWRR
jgi:polar amino acid transport system substrate-binding protein